MEAATLSGGGGRWLLLLLMMMMMWWWLFMRDPSWCLWGCLAPFFATTNSTTLNESTIINGIAIRRIVHRIYYHHPRPYTTQQPKHGWAAPPPE
jgi:hypothetical protein